MVFLNRYRSALIAFGIIVFLCVLFIIFLMRADDAPLSQTRQTLEAPDMSSTIELVFDAENPYSLYSWAIVDTERGETFIETNSFSQFGSDYELLLATRKANPEDSTYTIPDYMTLTLTVPRLEGGADVITYIDITADGTIDAVYLNDVEIATEDGLFVAQDQYSQELYASRDFMLDGISI